jgi:DNA-binding NtrC family response regulator
VKGGIVLSERSWILLVEPDQELREGMEHKLRESGYEVLIANDGSEALTILLSNTVDLIISALRMPNLDGIELMEEINRIKMNVPVIFMTAYGDVESYMDVMNMGAFDYLNKPVGHQEMLELAKRALETRTPARS